jgi:hypothetical protein
MRCRTAREVGDLDEVRVLCADKPEPIREFGLTHEAAIERTGD